MALSAGASTNSTGDSRRKRKHDADTNLCGMTKDEYESILSYLDSDD